MSTFPTALDTLATDKADATTASGDHPGHHNALADAVNKAEREIRATATFIIASSTSRRKLLADYVCAGTNDHTTINTALGALPSGGGRIVFLEGTFNLAGSISVPDKPVILEGQGKNTILAMGSGMTTAAVKFNASAGSYSVNLSRLEHLTVDGSACAGGATGAHGVEVAGCLYQAVFEGLHITGCKGHSMYFHGIPNGASDGNKPAYNRIVHCNIENGARDGIRLGDPYVPAPNGAYAEHNEIYHCVISFHTGNAIFASGYANRIHDNQIDYVDIGINLNGTQQDWIAGCTFDRCHTNCLKISPGGNETIVGCFFGEHRDSGGAVPSPASGDMIYIGGGASGVRFLANGLTKWGSSVGGDGWAYHVHEETDAGQSSDGGDFFGPNIYLGNHWSYDTNNFAGKRPVLIGNAPANLGTDASFGVNVRASGTATITAGTSVTVTHGLGHAPTRVFVTPTTSVAQTLAVTAKTSTTFTVTASASTTVDFDWLAQIGEG